MTDIVTTTGRRMTRQLQHALDNMTGISREAFISTAVDNTGSFAALYQAVALELLLCNLLEGEVLHGLSDDDTDGPSWAPPWPMPPRDGPALFVDTDPGLTSDTPPDAC